MYFGEYGISYEDKKKLARIQQCRFDENRRIRTLHLDLEDEFYDLKLDVYYLKQHMDPNVDWHVVKKLFRLCVKYRQLDNSVSEKRALMKQLRTENFQLQFDKLKGIQENQRLTQYFELKCLPVKKQLDELTSSDRVLHSAWLQTAIRLTENEKILSKYPVNLKRRMELKIEQEELFHEECLLHSELKEHHRKFTQTKNTLREMESKFRLANQQAKKVRRQLEVIQQAFMNKYDFSVEEARNKCDSNPMRDLNVYIIRPKELITTLKEVHAFNLRTNRRLRKMKDELLLTIEQQHEAMAELRNTLIVHGVEDEDVRSILVVEEENSDSTFMVQSFLWTSQHQNKPIFLLSLHNSISHHQQVAMRIGFSLDRMRQTDLLHICSPFEEQCEQRLNETTSENWLSRIESFLEEYGKRGGIVVVDGLSNMLVTESLKQTIHLGRRLLALIEPYNANKLVLTLHTNGSDQETIALYAMLSLQCELRMTLAPLKSGFSNQVTGHLSISRRRHWQFQHQATYNFSATERTVALTLNHT